MKGTKAKQAGRGVTLLALAAALGAAVYLNWSFAQDTPLTIDVQTEDTAAVSAEAGDEEAQAVQAAKEKLKAEKAGTRRWTPSRKH